MTRKQASSLVCGQAVTTLISGKRVVCTVWSAGRPYTNCNGRETLVFQLRTPAGNIIERHHVQLSATG